MAEVIIFGAGGHAHVIADSIRESGDTVLGFLDDNPEKGALGPVEDYKKYSGKEFVIGIGDSKVRQKISEFPCRWHTVIHPRSIVSKDAEIGEGTVVMANAVINAGAKIGKHCIVNTSAVVEHENEIADFAHISVGANLGGGVKVGKATWVGIGSIVNNYVTICEDSIIGAGAVVVKDIDEPGTYIGIPARRFPE